MIKQTFFTLLILFFIAVIGGAGFIIYDGIKHM